MVIPSFLKYSLKIYSQIFCPLTGTTLWMHTRFCLFHLSFKLSAELCMDRYRWNLWLKRRKRGEMSNFTRMFCSHCCRSEPEAINSCVYCRVLWPGFTPEWKPFPLRAIATFAWFLDTYVARTASMLLCCIGQILCPHNRLHHIPPVNVKLYQTSGPNKYFLFHIWGKKPQIHHNKQLMKSGSQGSCSITKWRGTPAMLEVNWTTMLYQHIPSLEIGEALPNNPLSASTDS